MNRVVKRGFNDLIRLLYEDINRRDVNFQIFKKLIDNAVIFDKNNKIISEDKDLLIDIPEKMMVYFNEHLDTEIPIEDVITLMKQSKHYSNIKNKQGIKIFYSIFDFESDIKIETFIRKYFNYTNEQKIKQSIIQLKSKIMYSNGICISDKNIYNICLNSKAPNPPQTLYHELSHLIQDICGIRLTSSTKSTKTTFDSIVKIKQNLQISDQQISDFFKADEWSVYVDNLIIGLSKTYIQYYSNNMDIFEFYYNIVLDTIIKTPSNLFTNSKFMFNYRIANNNDSKSMAMFYISYYLGFKYQKIKQAVWRSLNRKFGINKYKKKRK